MYPLGPLTLFDFTRPDDAADVLSLSPSRRGTTSSTTLYSRLRKRDAWRISDDRVIGGYSESLAHLIRPSPPAVEDDNNNDKEGTQAVGQEKDKDEKKEEEKQNTTAKTRIQPDDTAKDDKDLLPGDHHHDDQENDSDNDNDTPVDNAVQRPFLRWYGDLDTTVGLESNARRSGFAALRSPTFHLGGANLQGAYTALEVTCRSDGRVYTLNLQVTTGMPDIIFQGHIDVPATAAGKWDRLYLPFFEFGGPGARNFATRRQASQIIDEEDEELGDDDDVRKHDTTINQYRQEHFRRHHSAYRHSLEIGDLQDERVRLDNKIIIESVGFTLMDGQDGPFQFDLQQIRAVNFFENEVWEGVPEKK